MVENYGQNVIGKDYSNREYFQGQCGQNDGFSNPAMTPQAGLYYAALFEF